MQTNSKYIEGVQTKGEGNAQIDIIYNIKILVTQTGGIAIFTNAYNAIYQRLFKDVERVAKLKKSSKIKTVCGYRVKVICNTDEDESTSDKTAVSRKTEVATL